MSVELKNNKIYYNNEEVGELYVSYNGILPKKDEKYIKIVSFSVKDEFKNKGIGSKALKELIKIADKNNQIIVLNPEPFVYTNKKEFNLKQTKLKQYYRKFGFIDNIGKKQNFYFKELMIRYPNKTDYLINEQQLNELNKYLKNALVGGALAASTMFGTPQDASAQRLDKVSINNQNINPYLKNNKQYLKTNIYKKYSKYIVSKEKDKNVEIWRLEALLEIANDITNASNIDEKTKIFILDKLEQIPVLFLSGSDLYKKNIHDGFDPQNEIIIADYDDLKKIGNKQAIETIYHEYQHAYDHIVGYTFTNVIKNNPSIYKTNVKENVANLFFKKPLASLTQQEKIQYKQILDDVLSYRMDYLLTPDEIHARVLQLKKYFKIPFNKPIGNNVINKVKNNFKYYYDNFGNEWAFYFIF